MFYFPKMFNYRTFTSATTRTCPANVTSGFRTIAGHVVTLTPSTMTVMTTILTKTISTANCKGYIHLIFLISVYNDTLSEVMSRQHISHRNQGLHKEHIRMNLPPVQENPTKPGLHIWTSQWPVTESQPCLSQLHVNKQSFPNVTRLHSIHIEDKKNSA